MARPGVTYQDVANAANQLKGQGKNITIENVRAVLGTGSISTINGHLKKWKNGQDVALNGLQEQLPSELVSLIKGLWQQMLHQSSEQVMALEQTYQSSLAELEQGLQKYKNNNQRWQQLYNQWLQEKGHINNELLAMKQGLESSLKENQDWATKHNASLQQLEEKQERINELHRLHQQVQTNLEHYREAAREQRSQDLQQFEQQKNELQVQLKKQQEQGLALYEKWAGLQQEHLALKNACAALTKQQEVLAGRCEKLSGAHAEKEKQLDDMTRQYQSQSLQCQKAEEKIGAQTKELIHLHAEARSLAESLRQARQELENISSQNKLLAHDKWSLSQENAQLLGQLKQAEKIMGRDKASA